MPTIPVIKRSSAELRGLPGLRAPAASSRDLVGEAPEAIEGVARMTEKARADAADARLDAAYSELGSFRLELEAGLKSRRNQAALDEDLVAKGAEELGKKAREIAEKLSDGPTRSRFQAMYQREQHQLHGAMLAHVAGEAEEVAKGNYKASLATAAGKAAMAATDISPDVPDVRRAAAFTALGEARGEALEAVEARGRALSWSPQVLDQERRLALSALHGEVVSALQSSDRAAEAEAYLKLHASEMDGTIVADISRRLAPAALVSKGERAVRQAEAEHPGDRKAQLAAIEAIEGPVGQKALDVWKERRAVEEAVIEDAQRKKFSSVTNAIEQGAVGTQSQLEKHPAFAELDEERQTRARAYLRQEINRDRAEARSRLSLARQEAAAERAAAAAERTAQKLADDGAEKDFRGRGLEARAGLDLVAEYGGRVSVDGLNVLRRLQADSKRDWDKDRGLSAGEFTNFAKAEVQGLPAVQSKENLDGFLAWMQRKRSDWANDPKNAGKEPPRDLVRGWVIEGVAMGDYVSGNSWTSPDLPRFKANPNQAFYPLPDADQPYWKQRAAGGAPPSTPAPGAAAPPKAFGYEDIPGDERKLIEDAMRAKGKVPTPAAVLQRYLIAHPR